MLLCLDALGKSRSAEAIKHCDHAIQLDARNVAALNLRGNAHWSAGHGRLAIADFSRAIVLAPRNPEAFRFRANVYAALHQDALALADYNRAMHLAPSDPINVELRGRFYQQRRSYAQAIADFSAAVALRPSLARTWNSLCWTRLLANKNLSRALADCDRALSLDPHSTNALDSRGFVLLRMHRFAAAISSFSTALRLNPKLASSWFGRGVAKLRLSDKSAARDIAEATRLEPHIQERFLAYGMKFQTTTPPGT